MQFVPVNRPPPLEKKDETKIKSLAAPRPVKKAAAEAAAPFPLEYQALAKHPTPAEEKAGQAFRERSGEERRKYCRRLRNSPVLCDLRVEADRRRKNQRKDDITTAVDEVV